MIRLIIEAKPVYPKESSLEKQVFIGSFLGPFLALLTLSVALFYYSPQQMELPLAGLAGIYCSWKWHLRGAFASWALLAVVAGAKIIGSPETSLWWNASLATSIALACTITALTQRNVKDHLEWKFQDATEQHGRLAIAEGRLNTILQTVQQERIEAQEKHQTLESQLRERVNAQAEYTQFMEAARTELSHNRVWNEQLQRELVDMRQKYIDTQDQLEHTKHALGQAVNHEETLRKNQEELLTLRHTVDAYQHQIASYKEDLLRAKHQQMLIQEMGELIETLTREKKLLEATLGTLQTELEELQGKEAQRNQETSEDVTVTEESPRELRRLEGFYRQLREQFEEKSQVLDETRKELFQVQEKLNAAEKEIRERDHTTPQIAEEEHVRLLTKAENEFKQELEVNAQEIQRLYKLVDTLMGK